MMKTRVLSGLVLAAGLMSFPAMVQAAECRFERTLGVAGSGSLDAHTGAGSLKVVPGDGSHVKISGHVASSNSWFGGDAHEDVQRICDHPPIQQSGNEVKVGSQTNSDWFQHVSIDYVIEVPREFSVTANTGSGGLDLSDLRGPVVGISGSGSVHASNLGGGAHLHTGSGDIVANGIGGDARLETGSGTIHAGFASPGDVRASTGSGSIHLDNVAGALVAHTGSGTVEASGRPRSGWQIGTGSGTVKLHLPSNTGFTLNAQAGSGDVESTLPLTMQGSINKHHVYGTISGGGPEVHVTTGSGDIRID